jgi:hypothetical protein
MSDELDKTRRATWPIVSALIAAPLLYVASVGPMSYFAQRSGGGAAWTAVARTFYAPVNYFLFADTPIKNPLRGYVVWWQDLAD